MSMVAGLQNSTQADWIPSLENCVKAKIPYSPESASGDLSVRPGDALCSGRGVAMVRVGWISIAVAK